MEEDSPLTTIEIPLRWKRVLVGGVRFDWHRKKVCAARDRGQLFGPKVYKWEFQYAVRPSTKLYIGQCQNFEERLGKYRAAERDGRSTESRFQTEAWKHEEKSGTLDLYFLDVGTPICINGQLVNEHSLGYLDVRLMLESIAIVSARVAGFEVVNQLGENWHEKKIFELELVKNFVNVNGEAKARELFGFDNKLTSISGNNSQSKGGPIESF